MKYTIFGSTGFIGSSLNEYLTNQGHECYTPDIRTEDISNISLHHVIYAIGESEFIQKPLNAIDAHVCKLHKILSEGNFSSFLYISSGRFYYNVDSTQETDSISVNPLDKNQLYNISKLAGESLCHSSKKSNVKVIRPSNVTGKLCPSNLFIPSIIQEAIKNKKITLRSSLDSAKDFIHIDDLVKIIPKIIHEGKFNTYNIASGKNTTTKDLVSEISKLTDCDITIISNAQTNIFPVISIDRIQSEFNFIPESIISRLSEIIEYYKKLEYG